MLQKVFQVVLHEVSNLTLRHPLHVGVNKEDFRHILKSPGKTQKNTKTFFGALTRCYSSVSEAPECIFVCVHVVKVDFDHSDMVGLPLYVTDTFLNHYGVSNGVVNYLKPVCCFPLDKVVFGAKSSESYLWFKNSDLNQKMLAQCCQKNMLCRQEDVILFQPTFTSIRNGSPVKDISLLFENIILDCQPFHQGVLSFESVIVVADINWHFGKTLENFPSADNPGQMSKKAHILTYFNLMNYTATILGVPRILPDTTVQPLLASLHFTMTFEVRLIHKLSIHFQKELDKLNVSVDPLNVIFISKKAATKLDLTEGNWAHIKLISSDTFSSSSPGISSVDGNEKSGSDMHRLAQVCCFLDEETVHHYFHCDEVVYMSPQLWFNLNCHPSRLMEPNLKLLIKPGSISPPTYADEVFICLVQSPHYDGSYSFAEMINEYFTTPRYICKGDVFAIPSSGVRDFLSKDHDQNMYKCPIIYFRVSMIEGDPSPSGNLLDNAHSRLYLSGTKQSYIPVTMEIFYANTCHLLWNSPVPNGFKQYVHQIQDLILPFLNLQNKEYQMSSNILLSGPPCCGKTTIVKAACKCLNLHLFEVNFHEMSGDTFSTTEVRMKLQLDKGTAYAPCVILLKNVHFIGKEKDVNGEGDSRVLYSFCQLLKGINTYGSEFPVIVIATTINTSLLSNDLISTFLHSVHVQPPTEEERLYILHDLLTVCTVANDVSTLYLAQRTAGFTLGDLCALVRQALRNAYNRVRKIVAKNTYSEEEEEDMVLAGVPVVQKDLILALEKLQSEFAEAIGAPKIPNVAFDDVGGLENVKQEILDTIQLPLEHPEILISGLRRSGVLLYGPPGTGKTLLAKAVATECCLNFLSVKGPELINMYVGQSEENVRAVFKQARSAVPCIIFFDELDSLAPNRGRSGDSGGVMDRVVSQLLAELDGLNKKTEVFVIGATNRPDLIDPALLRPGRFDRLLYVGIAEDHKSRLSILKALTRRFPLAEDINLDDILSACPPQMSGADFYSLCSNAVIQRVEKNVDLLEKGEITVENVSSEVHQEDFLSVLESFVPSISSDQLASYGNHLI